MSNLTIRKIPFSFEGAAFIWNPANPHASILMNKISFFAIGFERYICRAMRDAEPLIEDPVVLDEARDFRAQESLHSQVHRKHVKALIARYPGLQGALDRVVAAFDDLYEAEPLAFHLGYVGGLESVFTPLFGMLLDHRDILFGGGDARVASMFIWHFFEEIEHRSSGLIVYDEVVGRHFYRIRNYRRYMAHSRSLFDALDAEFRMHVDDVPRDLFSVPAVSLPLRSRLRSLAGVVAAQLPWHDPTRARLPDYYHEWKARYDAGEDVRQIYGARTALPQASMAA